ncbi:hypothetical protein [Fimbriimonas ginsengisoli]|uniref:Uncharacterized protein n=1 Tax=Fimbriimonas ginsengisoli Gsoil 348 TaxID=661478 RepID=A0A068NRL8_FIMGI|nr:hypothetical protein [Fimbriimonas ginsengisoli]AIE85415.1 hypothetical protein OP10G_2047 [Fimbriimonas ginsengisoli Gsoil 348]
MLAPDQIITFVLLGMLAAVGIIAVMALIASRHDRDRKVAAATPQEKLEYALEMRRRRRFAETYPEWSGRDFEADRTSPWHTDPQFAE